MNECTITNPVLTIDWSISGLDQTVITLIFGGALFLWATGLGVGMLISVVRRFRIN